MDDCDAAAWWPDSAGERLTAVPLRRGGEAGVDELLSLRREGTGTAAGEEEEDCRAPELELVTDATRADASPVDRCCFGEAVLVVELRRHRRRLRALVVDEMLTASESRMRLGERN